MRTPLLIACVSAILLTNASAFAAAPASVNHIISTSALPAQVQELLLAQHGEIADQFTRLRRTCLVEPLMVGQRLAAGSMTPQRIQVDIEHARQRELTRIEFRLEDGEWVHVSTESFVPVATQNAAFAAMLKRSRTQPGWTPLPTDGTIGVALPSD